MTVRLLYGDALDGQPIGELPVTSVSAVDELNETGSLEAVMPLGGAGAAHLTGAVAPPALSRATLDSVRTAVWLDRDGVIVWSGMVWAVAADVASDTLTVTAAGWLSFLRRRTIYLTLQYSQADQFVIAKALLDFAQPANADVGITTDAMGTCGVLRDRTYNGYELKSVGEAFEQLAAVNGGFDFQFRSAYEGGAIVTRPILLYPPEGRATAHVFELGVNVDLLNYESDGREVAATVDAAGAGEGADMLIVNAGAGNVQYPATEFVISHTDVSETDTLVGHAQRYLQRHLEPAERLSLSVRPGAVPRVGSYIVGDLVRVRGSYGWLAIDGDYRIVTLGYAVEGGAERVTLDLVQTDLFL